MQRDLKEVTIDRDKLLIKLEKAHKILQNTAFSVIEEMKTPLKNDPNPLNADLSKSDFKNNSMLEQQQRLRKEKLSASEEFIRTSRYSHEATSEFNTSLLNESDASANLRWTKGDSQQNSSFMSKSASSGLQSSLASKWVPADSKEKFEQDDAADGPVDVSDTSGSFFSSSLLAYRKRYAGHGVDDSRASRDTGSSIENLKNSVLQNPRASKDSDVLDIYADIGRLTERLEARLKA